MPPLTRQQTLESLSSWWSDRNPNLRGPTINIHAAAKPLMKLLYNRQALEFIGKIDGCGDLRKLPTMRICLGVDEERHSGGSFPESTGEYDTLAEATLLNARHSGPMTRQQTFGSVRSWWSDRNPHLRGSTINLHAAAKPLMKLLYDRQALEFARNNRDILLSAVDAEIYGSYLSYMRICLGVDKEYHSGVSWRAQAEYDTLAEATLLNDIAGMLEAPGSLERPYSKIFEIISCLALHESSARVVVEQNVLNSLEKLLRSHPIDLYKHIFPILESLASHESTVMAVVHMLPLDVLGTLWRENVDGGHRAAPIDPWWEHLLITKLLGAPHKAVAEATCSSLVTLPLIFAISDSGISQVVDGALWALSRVPHLKFPPVTTGLYVEEKLLDHISDMLKALNTPKWRYLLIFQMLSHLALHESSATVIVERNVPNSIEKLLRSRPTDLYQHIFPILGSLVSHESTAMAVIRMLPLDLFGSLWRDSGISQVVDGALWALSCAPHLKFPPVTTGLYVEAKLLDHISDMLKALNTPKWRYLLIFQILSHLVLHESSARVIVEQNVLNSMEKLLRSRPTDLYKHIFPILESLASHESTATAVLNMRLYDLLETLWQYVSTYFLHIFRVFQSHAVNTPIVARSISLSL
ncbi:hypothetical protein C8J57DRAFT_1578930, partial [Mycena rebaudengoi]